jgi:hypothetical protein
LGSNGWFAQNSITHTASLRGVNVALYVGDSYSLELLLRDTTYRLRDVLNSLNISVYFNDYGYGQSVSYGYTGITTAHV